jgi:Tetrapyrrole (Corrin/Porphyrin) Methylases
MARGSLQVVGTGYLGAGQFTQDAAHFVRTADKLFHLVTEPVTRHWLEQQNPTAESLYDAYSEGRQRSESYREMVDRILAPVRSGLRVCAAFYGHPGVFVYPGHEAIRLARAEGFEAEMLPGISAEDCLFADLGLDPAAHGCQSFEASDFLLRNRLYDPTSLLILWQIGGIGVRTFHQTELWSREGLQVLAERLGETYGPEHEAVLYEAATLPVCAPRREPVRLRDLGAASVTLITTLCVPPARQAEIDPAMARRLGLAGFL